MAGWAILLGGFGGLPPHPLIVAVVAVAAVGGPASTIGFSLARDYNPQAMVGTATGVVNVGGFTSTIIASLLVGGVLEVTGPGSGYRLAFCCAVAVQVFGTAMAVRWWLRVRGHCSARSPVASRCRYRWSGASSTGASPAGRLASCPGRPADRRGRRPRHPAERLLHPGRPAQQRVAQRLLPAVEALRGHRDAHRHGHPGDPAEDAPTAQMPSECSSRS